MTFHPVQAHHGALGGLPPSFEFLQTATTAYDYPDTLSVTGVNFGVPDPNRWIVCCSGGFINSGSSRSTMLAASIGGVPATLLFEDYDKDDWFRHFIAFFAANVPTGTSGDVSITMNVTGSGNSLRHRHAFGVYHAIAPAGITLRAVHERDGSPRDHSVGTIEGGVMLANYVSVDNAGVWSGDDGFVQSHRFDYRNNDWKSGAFIYPTPTGTSNLSATNRGYGYSVAISLEPLA